MGSNFLKILLAAAIIIFVVGSVKTFAFEPSSPSLSLPARATDNSARITDALGNPSSRASQTGQAHKIIWHDTIQSDPNEWGLHLGCEHPINGVKITCDAENGANLSRVPDPAGGSGWAIRHSIIPSHGGGRAQLSTSTLGNPAFATQLANYGEVWIEQEMFIPAPIPSSEGNGPWISLMDFHSSNANGAGRWHTNPGLFLCSEALRCPPSETGKLVARDWKNKMFGGPSAKSVPINQWFRLQVHFRWSTSPVPVTYYVNGTQVLQITLPTKDSGHTVLEWYSKLYGGGKWTPNPLVRYTRNVRFSDSFIHEPINQ